MIEFQSVLVKLRVPLLISIQQLLQLLVEQMAMTPEWNRSSTLECGWRDSLMDLSNAMESRNGLTGTQRHSSVLIFFP